MLDRIANREDPGQSDLGLPCFSRPFWQTSSVQKFRTFTGLIQASLCKIQELFEDFFKTFLLLKGLKTYEKY